MVLLVLVLFFILWLLVSVRRRSKPLEVFTNTSGRVQVSRGALSDLVESAAIQFGVASRPRVDFKIRSGQVHIYIRLKLAAGQRLPEFSDGLQTHLANTLRDSFGLDKLAGVHLTVTGFKGRALPPGVDEPKPLTRPSSISNPPPATPPRPPGGNFFST
ncbi:MAG: alkaline shock response membrane anchor protein AmaP [Opitutales bacterium]